MIPRQARLWVVGGLVVVAASVHWLTPVDEFALHVIHVVMRKMFLVPVLLAAAWFGLRGALFTATAATGLYLPHVLYQWEGQAAENLNQIAEVASLWLAALFAGVLLRSERRKRRTLARIHDATVHEVQATLDAFEATTEQRHRDDLASYIDCWKETGESPKEADGESASPSLSGDEAHERDGREEE